MQRSIYLAKLIGPVFTAIGVGLLVNSTVYRTILEEGLRSPTLIYFSGMLVMPAGIALVLAHNVWVGDWRLILTLLGWLSTIGGAVRIVLPQVITAVGTSIFIHPQGPLMAGIAIIALGLALSYHGYVDLFQETRTPARRARKRSK